MGRHITAAVAGAVIACVAGAFVLHAMFVAGGYTREALVEPPGWVFAVVIGGGAALGLVVGCVGGRTGLPGWVRPVAIGALVGVAVVVLPTTVIIGGVGGPKGYGPYRQAALIYGVPVGLVAGAATGLVWAKRGRSAWFS